MLKKCGLLFGKKNMKQSDPADSEGQPAGVNVRESSKEDGGGDKDQG